MIFLWTLKNASGRRASWHVSRAFSVGRNVIAGGQVGRSEKGFALLEVFVGILILIVAVTPIYKYGLSNILSDRSAAQMEEALSRAQSLLDTVCRSQPLDVGSHSGEDGGTFRSKLLVSPLSTTALVASNDLRRRLPLRALLANVTVEISWGSLTSPHSVVLKRYCLYVTESGQV